MRESLLDFDLRHLQPLLGMDEVGLGCIAGPIVAAGVVLPDSYGLKEMLVQAGVRDSKRLSYGRREAALKAIQSSGAKIFIASKKAQEIDRLGLGLCLDRMYRSIITAAMAQVGVKTILLDGCRKPVSCYSLTTIVGGDDRSLSIAAASIVAKQHRDALMREGSSRSDIYKYGWDKNKGYPTKEHLIALEGNGPSPQHRMSTKPLRGYLSSKTTPGGSGLLEE